MDPVKLGEFIAKWERASSSERANKDHFLIDLCDLLGVERPRPSTGRADEDHHVFERDAVIVSEGGRETVGKIDLFKRGRRMPCTGRLAFVATAADPFDRRRECEAVVAAVLVFMPVQRMTEDHCRAIDAI